MTSPSIESSTAHPVSVVCADLSFNCLGRALVLAALAAREAPTRIVGLQSGDRIWGPAQSSALPIVARKVSSALDYPSSRRWLKKQLQGSRVIVSKPLFSSLGLTRWAGVAPEEMLLDNDDWEPGLREVRAARGIWYRSSQFLRPSVLNSYVSTMALDKRLSSFPHGTVSNAFLQSKYGGKVLPHVRDTEFLNPERVNKQALRNQHKMQGRLWVGFIGTVRPHKGVGELVHVLSEFQGGDAPGLYVAGVQLQDGYTRELFEEANQRLGSERVRFLPPFSFDLLPAQVAPVDIICLPGLNEPGALGQLPAKLMDAMCMGKAVVASGHNDIAELLDGCGVTVAPGDRAELSAALKRLLEGHALREHYGAKARERAVEKLSYEAGARILHTVFDSVPVFTGKA